MSTDIQSSSDNSPPRSSPVALVAGGSRGLGLLVARELAAHGYLPVICARSADELHQAVEQLAAWGHLAHPRACDVGDHLAVDALVLDVERELGPVEVAVHVAGIIQVGPLASVRREHFEEAVATMLWGPVNLSLAVLPGMRARGRGRIGIVSSIGGMVSVPHLLPYSVAKFAAVGLSQGLRAELAGSGVSVTTVAPGLMRTGSHLRAQFVGNHRAEYAWFAPGASLPLLSMNAERAAAKITRAVLTGKGLVLLTPLAKIAARFSGAAPGSTGFLMGVLARVLPAPADAAQAGQAVDGHEARARLDSRIVEALTVLGNRAARRFNQFPANVSRR